MKSIESKIKALMEKFSISEEEAIDLFDEATDSLSPEIEENTPNDNNGLDYNSDLHDVMESDIDMQTHNEDTPEFQSASDTFHKALSSLKANRKTALDALPTTTPQETLNPNERDLYTEAVTEYSDQEPEAVQQAVAKVEDLKAQAGVTMTPEEEKEHLNFFLNRSSETATMAYLKNADANMGAREKGKFVRSRFNPNYFKNVESGNWYELKLEKTSGSKKKASDVTNPEQPLTQEPSPESGDDGFRLEENEKQRLSRLLSDAQTNGVSPYHLLGTVSGFLGDKRMQSIGVSTTEQTDFQNGFREGAIARGGSAEIR